MVSKTKGKTVIKPAPKGASASAAPSAGDAAQEEKRSWYVTTGPVKHEDGTEPNGALPIGSEIELTEKEAAELNGFVEKKAVAE
ncbi:MAG TPA: hypothetical protein VF928_09245 [Usitatibacteraceae bacterium]